MSSTQVYGVVLPVRVAHHARVIAAIEGKSRSELMRDLLLSYLANYEPSNHYISDYRGEFNVDRVHDGLEVTK